MECALNKYCKSIETLKRRFPNDMSNEEITEVCSDSKNNILDTPSNESGYWKVKD